MVINEAAVEAAFAGFVAKNPDFAEYNTEANGRKLIEYMIGQWGPQIGENLSAWEIAFQAIKADLVPDNNYLSNMDKARLDGMSSADVRRAMRDPAFAELWRRYSVATVPLERTTNDPWISLDGPSYLALDPVRSAHLYATDVMFRRRVEKLIQQGAI